MVGGGAGAGGRGVSSDCDSGSREDFIDAARYIRQAAMQRINTPAMYELGEMFREGLLCDDLHMRFARRWMRGASKRGHAAAIVKVRELRSCVFCGGDDAPRACGLCGLAKYCDNAMCFARHWRERGGVGGGISGGGAGSRHRDVCPRARARTAVTAGSEDEDDDSEEEE